MVMGMEFPFPMVFPRAFHGNGNTRISKIETGIGRVHVIMRMGVATVFTCAKILIGRLDVNAI